MVFNVSILERRISNSLKKFDKRRVTMTLQLSVQSRPPDDCVSFSSLQLVTTALACHSNCQSVDECLFYAASACCTERNCINKTLLFNCWPFVEGGAVPALTRGDCWLPGCHRASEIHAVSVTDNSRSTLVGALSCNIALWVCLSRIVGFCS